MVVLVEFTARMSMYIMFTLYGILQQCNFLTKSIIRQHLRKVTVLIRFNKVNIMISDAYALACLVEDIKLTIRSPMAARSILYNQSFKGRNIPGIERLQKQKYQVAESLNR